MHPTLIHVGQGGIHTYGVMMAVGFIIAVLMGVRVFRRQGIPAHVTLDLAFWILVSAIVGSRVLYIITEAVPYYRLCVGAEAAAPRSTGQVLYDCTAPLHLWEGGLVFYGGLIGAVLTSWWFCRRRGLEMLRVSDLVIPWVALGHALGRLGCFCAGCCYGKITSAAVGVRFPPQSMAYQEMVRDLLVASGARSTPPLHPTQLYEAAVELSLFFLLLWVGRRKRRHGEALLTYLAIYPVARLLLEVVRADPDRHFVWPFATPWLSRLLGLAPGAPTFLSTSQLVSLLLLGVAVLLLRYLRRRPELARPPAR